MELAHRVSERLWVNFFVEPNPLSEKKGRMKMAWADALQNAAQEFDSAVKELEAIKKDCEDLGLDKTAKRVEGVLVLLRGVKK